MNATFTLPLRVVSEANAHEHWRVRQKRAKAQRALVALVWAAQVLPRNRKPETVILTRRAPRTLDSDNLAVSFKHVRDEVAALCGFDDRAPDVRWVYAQEKAKTYGVRVEVVWQGVQS